MRLTETVMLELREFDGYHGLIIVLNTALSIGPRPRLNPDCLEVVAAD